jgi:hypothetical protein
MYSSSYNSEIKCFRTHIDITNLSCFGAWKWSPEFVCTFQLHSVYSNSSAYRITTKIDTACTSETSATPTTTTRYNNPRTELTSLSHHRESPKSVINNVFCFQGMGFQFVCRKLSYDNVCLWTRMFHKLCIQTK